MRLISISSISYTLPLTLWKRKVSDTPPHTHSLSPPTHCPYIPTHTHSLPHPHTHSLPQPNHTPTHTVSALTSSKSSNDPREHYLGLLYPSEQYKMYPFLVRCHNWPPPPTCSYGYATNTRVKLIIVTENTTSQSRDIQIKAVSYYTRQNLTLALLCSCSRVSTWPTLTCSLTPSTHQALRSTQSKLHHSVLWYHINCPPSLSLILQGIWQSCQWTVSN